MKEKFKSFIVPSPNQIEIAWKSDNTIFIFDTNVFLNLYGYEERTKSDFFETLSKIEDKVWIPFHVGLEYHRRRLTIIKNEKKLFREVNNTLDKLKTSVESCIRNNSLDKKFPELNKHLNTLSANIEKEVKKCKEKVSEWDKRQPDVRSNDSILDMLEKYTAKRIGDPPTSQEWLDQLYAEGATRYANKIPPGFKDEEKSKGDFEDTKFFHNGLLYERQYGDLIIWKQIIEKAVEGKINNIFLITDDLKDDWWSIIDSGGDKHIGPHEGLKSEIYRSSDIGLFHMYSTSDFLRESQNILSTKISEKSIKDAHDKNEKLAADFLESTKVNFSAPALPEMPEIPKLTAIPLPSDIQDILKRQSIAYNIPELTTAQRAIREWTEAQNHLKINISNNLKSEIDRILEQQETLKKYSSMAMADHYNSIYARNEYINKILKMKNHLSPSDTEGEGLDTKED